MKPGFAIITSEKELVLSSSFFKVSATSNGFWLIFFDNKKAILVARSPCSIFLGICKEKSTKGKSRLFKQSVKVFFVKF